MVAESYKWAIYLINMPIRKVILKFLLLYFICSFHEVAQSCPTLCDPVNCSLPGSSVHGIFQARILEWVAISFSRGSSRPRDRTQVSHIAGRRFTLWAISEALFFSYTFLKACMCTRENVTFISLLEHF